MGRKTMVGVLFICAPILLSIVIMSIGIAIAEDTTEYYVDYYGVMQPLRIATPEEPRYLEDHFYTADTLWASDNPSKGTMLKALIWPPLGKTISSPIDKVRVVTYIECISGDYNSQSLQYRLYAYNIETREISRKIHEDTWPPTGNTPTYQSLSHGLKTYDDTIICDTEKSTLSENETLILLSICHHFGVRSHHTKYAAHFDTKKYPAYIEVFTTDGKSTKFYIHDFFEVSPTFEPTPTPIEILWCSPDTYSQCELHETWTRDGIEMGILSEKIHPSIGEEIDYQFFIGHSWEFYDDPWASTFEKGTIVVAVPEDVEINYEGIRFYTAAGGPTGPRGWYAYEQPEEDECAEAALKGIIGQLPIGFLGNIFGFGFTVEEITEKCNSEYEYDWLEEKIKEIDKNKYDIIAMPWRAEDSYGVRKRSGVNLIIPLTFEKEGWIKCYYQFWHDGKRVVSSDSILIKPVVGQAAKGTQTPDLTGEKTEVPALEDNKIPGFELAFAIAELLAIAYLFGSRE